jgi:Taurine catabolism dioxygenase TauD, TfdA family
MTAYARSVPAALLDDLARHFETEVPPDPVAMPLVLRRRRQGKPDAAALKAIAGYADAFGAVLLRDSRIGDATAFQELADGVSALGRARYREMQSPRLHVVGNVFTSTEHPASQRIHPHNENVHCSTFPKRIYFYCERPAERDGATTMASNRAVQAGISPAVLDLFRSKGVRYKRSFGFGFGFPWQVVFGSDQPPDVERYCEENDIRFAWAEDGKLRIWYDRPAFVVDPAGGEAVWCNNVVHYHPSTIDARMYRMYKKLLADEDMPFSVAFGDGSPIPMEIVEELRAAYAAVLQRFDWAPRDVLILDNVLFAHGRESFAGDRRILVTMSDTLGRVPHAPLGSPAAVHPISTVQEVSA